MLCLVGPTLRCALALGRAGLDRGARPSRAGPSRACLNGFGPGESGAGTGSVRPRSPVHASPGVPTGTSGGRPRMAARLGSTGISGLRGRLRRRDRAAPTPPEHGPTASWPAHLAGDLHGADLGAWLAHCLAGSHGDRTEALTALRLRRPILAV